MTHPQDAGWTSPSTAPPAPPVPQAAGQPAPQPAYGMPPQPAYPGAARPPMPGNRLGVAALVLGIMGMLGCLFVGGIPAIILGTKGRKAVRAGRADNDGLAIAGIVTGWIAVVFGLFWVVFFAFFAFLDAIKFGYG